MSAALQVELIPTTPASEDIRQFEFNPHQNPTAGGWPNPEHVDDRFWIIEVPSSKVPQTICRLHVSKRSWVGPDILDRFGIGDGELCTILKIAMVVLLALLHQMI